MPKKTPSKTRVRRLPPDAGRRNAVSAKRAGGIVAEMQMRRAREEDCPQSELRGYLINDFLSDLAHWLDRNPKYGTLAEAIDSAMRNYGEETQWKGVQFDG